MALKRKRPDDQLEDDEPSSEQRLTIDGSGSLPAFASYNGSAAPKQDWDLDAFAPYKPASNGGSLPTSDTFSAPLSKPVEPALLPDETVATRMNLDKTLDFGLVEDSGFGNGLQGLHAAPVDNPEEVEQKLPKGKKSKEKPEPVKPEELFDVSYATDWSQYADPLPPPLNPFVEEEPIIASAPARPIFSEPEEEHSPVQSEPARLFVRLGKFSATYDLDVPEMIVGRPDPDNNFFPEITIEWDDAVSRRHARIYRNGNEDYIEDLGSTNGTKVNGVPLYPHNAQLLANGDLIHLGSKTEIGYYK